MGSPAASLSERGLREVREPGRFGEPRRYHAAVLTNATDRGWRPRKGRAPRYQDGELLDCLRKASSAVDGQLTVATYNRLVAPGNCPSSQTHINRFGSWRVALHAAGLEANPTSAVSGRGRWNADHCASAVRDLARAVGHGPTALEYQSHARANPGVPSLSTVRKLCGSWAEALAGARQERG
ncbi:MAG: homing endonuclease associated repeat-containing protein [Candidatus Dormibacteria bacterium]